jgi:hypothetical protein
MEAGKFNQQMQQTGRKKSIVFIRRKRKKLPLCSSERKK